MIFYTDLIHILNYVEQDGANQQMTWITAWYSFPSTGHSAWKYQLPSQSATWLLQTNHEVCKKPRSTLSNGEFTEVKFGVSLFSPRALNSSTLVRMYVVCVLYHVLVYPMRLIYTLPFWFLKCALWYYTRKRWCRVKLQLACTKSLSLPIQNEE